MKTTSLAIGLMIVFLLLLSGCSGTPEPQVIIRTVTVTKPVPVYPPADLFNRCLVTETFEIKTNRDLLLYAKELEQVIQRCDRDAERQIEWLHRVGGQ